MTKAIPPIPDDLWGRIYGVMYYAVPHKSRPDQKKARRELRQALALDRTELLPEALRALGRTRTTNIHGKRIPLAKCHITRVAYALALEVEGWIADQRRQAA